MSDTPAAPTQPPAMPPVLYVQKGITGAQEEFFTNSTQEKALGRTLGGGRKAGDVVGVYKLDRVVAIKAGIVEIPQADAVAQPVAQNT